MSGNGKIRVGVVGASGLARRRADPAGVPAPGPGADVPGRVAARRPQALGTAPGLRRDLGLVVEEVTEDVADRVDVLLLSTPGARCRPNWPRCSPTGWRASIDLSGAFRIRTTNRSTTVVPEGGAAYGLADRFVYGVPELVGEQMVGRTADLPAGCYATAITLGLAPLVFGWA